MKRKVKLLKSYVSSFLKDISQFNRKITIFFKRSDLKWLETNKVERMDALIVDDNYTNESRREFHLDRYRFATGFVKGKKVMDIACGTGYGTRILLEEGYADKCIGVDIDKKAVLYAKKKHNVSGSDFICSSAENVPMNSEFADVIVSFETIEHVYGENLLIDEFYRLLKKDGLFIVSTPNSWPLSIAPFHTKEYDLDEFKRVLETKFEIESIYNQNSGTPWKYNHNEKRGIVVTTDENKNLAECFIAVCKKK